MRGKNPVNTKQFRGLFVRFLSLTALLVLLALAPVKAQMTSARGTISGTVTADQGVVRGFRVKAHSLKHRLWYTVFTNSGHYQIPQALSGPYEVSVLQEGYASPAKKIDLAAGQTATVDLAVTKQPPPADVVEQDFDTIYPPGPARTLVMNTCLGCHGIQFYRFPGRDENGWRAAVRLMTNGPSMNWAPPLGRTQLSQAERDTIVKYLATNLGPNRPKQIMKVDALVPDEDVLAKTIFVEYEVADMPYQDNPPQEGALVNPFPNDQQLHDPFVAPNGKIWFSAPTSNLVGRLDPRELDTESRWKTFKADPAMNVLMHGISVDSKGHVYWAELVGGRVGELDPETGTIKRHVLPTQGAVFQVATDKDDNVWYDQIQGGCAGRLDSKTKMATQWCTPTADLGLYGLTTDQKGNAWLAGVAKGIVAKIDPVAQTVTEYSPPTQRAGTRRLGVDSKGMVWFSEYLANQIGSIDPATGKITEYKLPLQHTQPYETWPDKSDNIWVSDAMYGSLIKYDQTAKKFTYFPLPQLHWDVPKIEVEPNNTIWFGSRGVPHLVAVHLYPNGYSVSAPPEP